MSKKFTPKPTTVNGYLQSRAPVNGCIESTAGNHIPEPDKDINDAKQRDASFFLFRKPAGKRKIISKYELPLQEQQRRANYWQLPTSNCKLPSVTSHLSTKNITILFHFNTTAL